MFASTFIPAVVCPSCGDNANLMRREPNPAGNGELRTFECRSCDKKVTRVHDGEETDERLAGGAKT